MQNKSDMNDNPNQECLSDDRDRGNGRNGVGKNDRIPFWAWGVAILGLILVTGSICFMVYGAIKDSSPPDVAVLTVSVIPVRDGYLVKIRAVNRGGSAVAGLNVEGELRDDAGAVETSEATVDYVPSHSEREAGLFFKKNPKEFKLQLRAKGYEKP